MFTGLIQQKSPLLEIKKTSDGMEIWMARPSQWNDLKNGESIAVDGACLTLVTFDSAKMSFFMGAETLKKTTLVNLTMAQEVNLERSLAFGDRLGGHMVSGHVDGTGVVVKREEMPSCLGLQIQVSRDQFRWIVPKGSICLNGVSLTVNQATKSEDGKDCRIDVLLIPETLERTNLKNLKVGSRVNVECDQTVKIIAHQVQAMMEMMPQTGPDRVK